MKLEDFDFELNKELIALHPVVPRHNAKMLEISKDGVLQDRHFYDLPNLLNEGDLLVFNDSKVIPAKLYGYCKQKKFELYLNKPIASNIWSAFVKKFKN